MKSKAERSRDMDRAYEELGERLLNVPGVVCEGEHGAGLAYRVRRLGMAALDVVMTVDLIDGQLWWRMRASLHGPGLGLPTLRDVEWCKHVFTGKGAGYIPLPSDAALGWRHVDVLVPLEQDPLRGVAT